MQEGANQNDSNVGVVVNAESSEDEKEVNVKKLRDEYLIAMNDMLQQEFNEWQLQQSDDDQDRLTLSKDEEQKITLVYRPDGLQIQMQEVNDESIRVMVGALSTYQALYNRYHPKTELKYELICNGEQEARKILKEALKENPPINITKLSFYSEDEGKDFVLANELLEQIKSEFKSGKKPKV